MLTGNEEERNRYKQHQGGLGGYNTCKEGAGGTNWRKEEGRQKVGRRIGPIMTFMNDKCHIEAF